MFVNDISVEQHHDAKNSTAVDANARKIATLDRFQVILILA